MKFCKDCRHCIPYNDLRDPYKLARCAKVKNLRTDWRVSGEGEEYEYGWCSTARIGDKCGENALLFEPIIPIETHTA